MPKGEKLKNTYEHVCNIFSERGFELLSKEYGGYKDKLTFRDSDGYLYCMGFSVFNHSDRKLYKFHTNNKHTLDNLRLWLIKNNINLEILENEYIRNSQKLLVKTKEGYLAYTTLDTLTQGNTPYIFDKRNPHTIKNINTWCDINKSSISLLSDEYKSNINDLKWQCNINGCSSIFYMSWNEVQSGHRCSYCASKKLNEKNCLATKNPELAKEWHPTRNGDLNPNMVFGGSHKKVWWVCSKCGKEWEAQIKSRHLKGYGCGSCTTNYRGELKLIEIFDIYGIERVQHKTFSECKNVARLSFDFYLPNYNILVEFQGKQHYEPIEYFGGEKSFKKQQINDQIKKEFAIKNNIKLIEIPYWDFDKIDEILVRELDLKLVVNT